MESRARPDPEELLGHAGWLRRLAQSLVPDAATAEDLVQETWKAALEHPPRQGRPLAPWLARVLRNFALRRSRGEARRRVHEERGARPEHEPSSSELLERAALQRELIECVLALEEPYRSTLLLRYYEELSPSAIARREKLPVRTVKTRLARGLERLRERLHGEHRGELRDWTSALFAFAHAPRAGLFVGAGGAIVKLKIVGISVAAFATLVATLWISHELSRQELAQQGSLASTLPEARGASSPSAASEADAHRTLGSTADRVPERAVAAIDAADLLRGVVVDGRLVPIPKARVTIQRNDATNRVGSRASDQEPPHEFARIECDAQGRFQIALNRGRPFDVLAEADGFARLLSPAHQAGEELQIVLHAPAQMRGRVSHEEDGTPCAGARVRLFSVERYLPGVPNTNVECDQDGRYSIDGLPAGYVRVTIAPRDAEALQAGIVELVAGGVMEKDFSAPAGMTVGGVVLDALTGEPIVGAAVTDLGYAERAGEITDVHGHYMLHGAGAGWPRGAYVRVTAPGYGPCSVRSSLGQVRPLQIDFQLERSSTVRGRVIGTEGQPIEGALVLISKGSMRRTTRSGVDGGFACVDLPRDVGGLLTIRKDGFAALNLQLPAPDPLPSAKRERVIDFGTLTLQSPSMVLGRVVDARGTGIPGMFVTAQASHFDSGPFDENPAPSGGADCWPDVRTDAHGCFGFADLGAGSYLIDAGRKGCTRRGTANIVVGPGETIDELVIPIDLGLSIEGGLLDSEGRAVSDGVIDLYAEPDAIYRTSYTITLPDGGFRFEGLVEGSYNLVAQPDGFSEVNRKAELCPQRLEHVRAGDKHVRVCLPRSATITGRVLRPDGSPGSQCVVNGTRSGRDREDWPEFLAFTGPTGEFRMVVPQGVSVDLSAQVNGFRIDDVEHIVLAARAGVQAGTSGIELHLAPVR